MTDSLRNAGGKLFFAARTTSKNPYDIYFINLETGKSYQVTENGAADISPDFKNGSNLLAFSSDRSGTYDIYDMILPDGGAQQLTTASSDETEPRISPDGSRIAYQSNGSGRFGYPGD